MSRHGEHPVKGVHHDSSMLGDSGLMNKLKQYATDLQSNVLCIYSDHAYPLCP